MIHSILIICLIVIWLFWTFFYIAYLCFKKSDLGIGTSLPPVSVIISCKNAETTIRTTVEAILKQKLVDFELIIIDDFSSDGTYGILRSIKDPKLVVVSANEDKPGKKAALTQAIRQARHEILLFTDADCFPSSDLWIRSMLLTLLQNPKTEIVLGYGPMYKKNTWINTFARYETWLTAMQYFSYAIFKMPYMGVGRNLMYKKSAFQRVNGFIPHEDMASGDDDLFIATVANRHNIDINLDANAFAYSHAKESFTTFLKQKTRHVSTSVRYRWKHQLLLSTFATAQTGFYICIALGLANSILSVQAIFIFVGCKWLVQSLLHFKWMYRLDSKDLLWYFPLLDMMLSVYYLAVSLYSIFRKKHTW
jgi:poly-beta-1,6-N-acetyl-D-glucosamine synthase